jgi:hypothetical protein
MVISSGKLLLRANGKEEEKIVEGKHEPLISEELFLKVQNVLRRKGTKDLRLPGGRAINNERYPLRGILLCPKCGNNLTASGSKGRKSITTIIIAVLPADLDIILI